MNELANIGNQNHYLDQSVHFNPNWSDAQKHGKASRVGISSLDKAHERCICCFQQIQKQQIPLDQNTKQLEFLGFGFPLYYAFVRNCIFLLIVTVCSYNLIALYRAIVENNALCLAQSLHTQNSSTNSNNALPHSSEITNQQHPEHTKNNLYFMMRHFNENQNSYQHFSQTATHPGGKEVAAGQHGSQSEGQSNPLQCTSWMIFLARIQKKVWVDQQILRAVSIAIHMILLVYIKDKLLKMRDYFDERTASPSDYSAFIKKIPQIDNIRIILQKKISQQYNINQRDIQQIILIPNMNYFQKKEEQKHDLINKLRKKIKKNQFDAQAQELQHEIRLNQLDLQKDVVKMKMQYNKNQLKATRAIIILNNQRIKNQLIQKHQQKQFIGSGWEHVTIQQAPEPRQIIWENISLSSATKRTRTIIGWVFSLLLLAVLTVIFALLSKKKSQIVEQEMHQFRQTHNQRYQNQALLLVFGMIFFVVLFNKIIITNLFHVFTDFQRHASTYKFQFSFCLKYCLGLFFTTALMTLIVQAFILHNYYKHDYGVIEQQTIMYVVNSLFVPLFWAIHPVYLFKRIKLHFNKGKKHFTQAEANKMMELPEYDVGKRYGEVLEVMWFTYLYMTLIPLGGIISTIGLALYYWIDKYNLLRRSCISSNVSGSLIMLTLRMLNFTLVLRTAGDILFDYQIRNGPTTSGWIFLAIAIFYQFIPFTHLINFFNQEKFKTEETPYQVAQLNFKQSYYDQHILFSHLQIDRQNLAQQLINKLVARTVKAKAQKNY